MELVCILSAQVPSPGQVRSDLPMFPDILSQIPLLRHLKFELLNHQHNPKQNISELISKSTVHVQLMMLKDS